MKMRCQTHISWSGELCNRPATHVEVATTDDISQIRFDYHCADHAGPDAFPAGRANDYLNGWLGIQAQV